MSDFDALTGGSSSPSEDDGYQRIWYPSFRSLHRGVHLLRARGFRCQDLSIKLRTLGLDQAANV